MRLAETIGRWLGRVEVVLAGAEGALREGEEALAEGDAMRARGAAHEILARVPGSPLGLALLADACELGGLDAELALTLEELAGRVASRADVWVRLGRAREATSQEEAREAYVRALTVAEAGSEARREALLALADLDLSQGDGARAELWLERTADAKSAAVLLRRAEARLAQGDGAGARVWLESFESEPTDGRAALARGRALAIAGDPAAFLPLVRAYVLEAPGASEALSSALAWIQSDEETRARVRVVVEGQGESALARWRAAFARAEGRRDEARAALREAISLGDASAARPLLDAALDDQDYASLRVALDALPSSTSTDAAIADARRIPSPAELADPSSTARILDALALVADGRAKAWADAARRSLALAWIPGDGKLADWPRLLSRLDTHSRTLHDLDATARVAQVSVERSRPVRVAVVGEFNAGKSTFINALIGADVAPTGVLPTTATLHHLRYAPDSIARILFVSGDPLERIVPLDDLRKALKTCDPGAVRRVEILLPIASLTRVEILDTPGFNAPDSRHTEAARAAFDEADAAIWLVDAGQAMKKTERVILEQARASKLPVQILVNKADRLAAPDVQKVMELVASSLEEAKLQSWSKPLALSARLALAGKLGDEAALAASGWAAVQALLDTQIVGRSEELKERALRRRVGLVVAQLQKRATELATEEKERLEAQQKRAQENAQLAAKLDREAEEAAQILAGALNAAAQAWRRDLDVVVTGRDPDAAAADPVLLRYRVDRAVTRLAPALAQVMSRLAGGAPEAELLPFARALVRAFAGTSETSLAPLARSAIGTLVERLSAQAVAPVAAGGAHGLVAELSALADALA